MLRRQRPGLAERCVFVGRDDDGKVVVVSLTVGTHYTYTE